MRHSMQTWHASVACKRSMHSMGAYCHGIRKLVQREGAHHPRHDAIADGLGHLDDLVRDDVVLQGDVGLTLLKLALELVHALLRRPQLRAQPRHLVAEGDDLQLAAGPHGQPLEGP